MFFWAERLCFAKKIFINKNLLFHTFSPFFICRVFSKRNFSPVSSDCLIWNGLRALMAMFLTHYLHPYSRFFSAKFSRAPHSGLTRKFRRGNPFSRAHINAFHEFFFRPQHKVSHTKYIFPALTLSFPSSSFLFLFLGKSGDERSVTFSPGPLFCGRL